MGVETLTKPEEAQEKKQSRAETGHAINAANFAQLVTVVKSFTSEYNPSWDDLKLENLEILREKAGAMLSALHQADSAYRDAVNKRQTEFDKMNDILTRINGSLKAAGIDTKLEEEFAALNKKLRGKGLKSANPENTHSTSQMSYDSRLNNFTLLVIKLKGMAGYKPNEALLTVESLDAYINNLHQVTDAADKAWSSLDIARSGRDNFLYADTIGLVPLALRVKAYTKSLFGTKSREYRALANLKFKNK